MNELESQIVSAAIQFIVQLATQIMQSQSATDEQKAELLKSLSARLLAEVEKVKNAEI